SLIFAAWAAAGSAASSSRPRTEAPAMAEAFMASRGVEEGGSVSGRSLSRAPTVAAYRQKRPREGFTGPCAKNVRRSRRGRPPGVPGSVRPHPHGRAAHVDVVDRDGAERRRAVAHLDRADGD